MRWLVPLFYLALALAVVATALALDDEPRVGARVLAAEGGFGLTNSHDGESIFTASGIAPGESAAGTVELTATGSKPAALTLAKRDLEDTPGLGGGLLSSALTLRVRELGAVPTIVYSGPLATMPLQELDEIEPGAPRRYEFVATLPEAGTAVDQNALQGAATSVAYEWTASEAGKGSPSPGPGPGTGGGTPGGGPALTPPPAPPVDRLELAVTSVRHRIKRGRLVIWARCDRPCAIVVRGRVRVRGESGHRAAKLRYRAGVPATAAPRRLRIKLPGGLRRWLAADPRCERLRVKVTVVARDAAGESARVRRTLRLRSAR